jgi:hypothetical protein
MGIEKDFRAFPYHCVSKRIAAGETGFFKRISITLLSQSREELKATHAI